jgi:hypothetical protein
MPTMAARAPSLALAPPPEPIVKERANHAFDEADVARWAAFYESLPADLREGLDELGQAIGR